MDDVEFITHIRVNDRDYNAYISICYTSMRLHVYKYDETSIEWETFTNLEDFAEWIQEPIKRVKI